MSERERERERKRKREYEGEREHKREPETSDLTSKVLHFPHFQFPCATRIPVFPFFLSCLFYFLFTVLLQNSIIIHCAVQVRSTIRLAFYCMWPSSSTVYLHCLFCICCLAKMRHRVGLCRHLDNDVSLILLRWPISAIHFVP